MNGKRKNILLSLELQQNNDLEFLMKESGVTKTVLIRRIINDYIERLVREREKK